jgi:hypothetical protein
VVDGQSSVFIRFIEPDSTTCANLEEERVEVIEIAKSEGSTLT